MNFLNAVKTVLGMLPALIEAIKAIEFAFPEGGKGAQKLELVRNILASTYTFAEDTVAQFETVWKMLVPVIASIVSFANTIGAFKK
jgi:hypothetical protein